MQGGAESSWTDKTGYFSVYSSSLSHRSENALVWKLFRRWKGSFIEGNEARVYIGCSFKGKVYDCVAVSALGTGYT